MIIIDRLEKVVKIITKLKIISSERREGALSILQTHRHQDESFL